MANFRAHLTVACTFSGALATTALYANLATPFQAMQLWAIGTLGGMFPDIDSPNSVPLRISFTMICALCAYVVSDYLRNRVPLAYNFAGVITAMAALRFAALPAMARMMVHRGNCHSLLACLTFSLVATNIGWHLFGLSRESAFLLGIFFCGGFLSHLILDEVCSICFDKVKLKKSFGTAIKPFSKNSPFSTVALMIACGVQLWWLPDTRSLQVVLAKLTQTTLTAFS